jgi:hypothetical protein
MVILLFESAGGPPKSDSAALWYNHRDSTDKMVYCFYRHAASLQLESIAQRLPLREVFLSFFWIQKFIPFVPRRVSTMRPD